MLRCRHASRVGPVWGSGQSGLEDGQRLGGAGLARRFGLRALVLIGFLDQDVQRAVVLYFERLGCFGLRT